MTEVHRQAGFHHIVVAQGLEESSESRSAALVHNLYHHRKYAAAREHVTVDGRWVQQVPVCAVLEQRVEDRQHYVLDYHGQTLHEEANQRYPGYSNVWAVGYDG